MTSLNPSLRCWRVNKEDVCLFDSTGANKRVCPSWMKSHWYKCGRSSVHPNVSDTSFNFCNLFCLAFLSAWAPNSHFLICFRLKSELWVMAFICDGSFYFHFNSCQHLKPDGLIIILMLLISLLIQPKSSMLQYFTTKHFTPGKKIPKQDVIWQQSWPHLCETLRFSWCFTCF